MSWPEDDDKSIRGPRDQRFVSRAEDWEVREFIKGYLASRGIEVTTHWRFLLRTEIERYPGPSPIPRDELARHLDERLKLMPVSAD